MDPLSAMFGGSSYPGSTNSQGSYGNNLQLAPIYSSQRHNTGGETQFPREDSNRFGDYEEEQETYSNVDASGFHFGVRMSRTHQTPFGPARANAGMQMSIGQNGISMISRSSSSLDYGGGGGSMFMLSFGGSPRQGHLGQRRCNPMRSLFSPFGGLFSPHNGLSSSMSGDPSLFGLGGQAGTDPANYREQNMSDGPIIEEIFDEEESRNYSGSINESSRRSEYKEDKMNELLGLGLLPDEDTVSNDDRKKGSTAGNNGVLNDSAFSEETQSTSKSRKKNERNVKPNKNEKRRRKKPQTDDTKTGMESVAEIAQTHEGTDNFDDQPLHPCNSSQNTRAGIDILQSENSNRDCKEVPKARQRFSKQEFKKIPLQLDDGLNILPFLGSPSVQENIADSVPPKPLGDCSSVLPMQSKKRVNKNSYVRRRHDSSDSISSRLENQEFDNESTKSHDIATDILDLKSFHITHNEVANTELPQTDMAKTTEDILINEYAPRKPDAICESQQRPIKSSDPTEKVFLDEGNHISSDSSVDFTKALPETADRNTVIGTGDVISEIGTSSEKNGFTREATGDKYTDELNFVDGTPEDRHSPVCFEMTDNNNGQPAENDDCFGSLEIDTFEEGNEICRTENNSEHEQQLSHEQEHFNPLKEFASAQTENTDVESKSNSKDSIIEESIAERNRRRLTTPSQVTDIAIKTESTSSLLGFPFKDSEIGNQTTSRHTRSRPIHLIFVQLEAETDYDSNREITIFMPSKDRKNEAGQTFQVNHFKDGHLSEDVATSIPDINESAGKGNVFTDDTNKADDDAFKKVTDLRRRSEDERASPKLESFQFESQSSIETDSSVDFKVGNSQRKTPERKSNIKPLTRSNLLGDDDQQNFFHKSTEQNDQATNIQWEYPRQRSTSQNPLNQNNKQSYHLSNLRDDFPSGVEKDHQLNLNRTWPQRANFVRGGDDRHNEGLNHVERDLSNLPRTGSSHSYHEGHNDARHNADSHHEHENPNSGEFMNPTTQETNAYQTDGNRYNEEYQNSYRDLVQSDASSNHEKDVCTCHMCPHLKRQAQCEHKFVYEEFHHACQHNHYYCGHCDKQLSFKEYSKRKRVSDNDDIFEHPDWKFLNEYKDENEQFREPKPPPKPKQNKNKNATIKASTKSASAFATQDVNIPTSVPETRHSTEFSGLVESVGLILKDVYPDGNCLFTSVCDQLRVRGDFSYTPRDLRHAAVDFLRENPNQDDGTPLLDFLADEERNWEKYLRSMRRDGHWGDHFVIWALAHVLNMRIVIYRGDKELHKTIVEPSASMKKSPSNEDVDDSTTKGQSQEESNIEEAKAKAQQEPTEEMYLGHISESHYVSLRPSDWRENLFEELKKRKTSSLVGINPDSKALDSNGDVFVRREVNTLSSRDLNFFLNYLRRGQVIYKLQTPNKIPKSIEGSSLTNHFINDYAFGFEYELWGNIGSRSAANVRMMDSVILTTATDSIVTRDHRHAGTKDLIIHDNGQMSGTFRLTPVQPNLWKPKLAYADDIPVLKQLEYEKGPNTNFPFKIGFKSASWPEEAMEWKLRKRLFDWPSQTTIDEILETGARVVPANGKVSDSNMAAIEKVDKSVGRLSNVRNQPSQRAGENSKLPEDRGVMWQYDFSISESILYTKEIHEASQKLYCILQAVSRFAFAEKSLITNRHLRTLLYFTCENHSIDDIRHQPGKCLLYELDLLREFLQRKHFPNYFMRGRNLIADIGYEDIAWHIERLEFVLSNFLVVLYCMLEYCTLRNVYDIGTVFNSLCRVVALRNEDNTTSDDYPVLVCVTSLANNIKSKMYKRARGMIDTWYSELLFYFGRQMFSKREFVGKMFDTLPLQDQWLFALYIDCRDGSDHLQYVCRELPCVPFENLFGGDVKPILLEETSLAYDELRLPSSILNQSMVTFANRLGETLYHKIGSIDAYRMAIHHFLKSNTYDLLLSIESDQRVNYDNYAQMKLSQLADMFEELYYCYEDNGDVYMFRDLMETCDKLCNFLATEYDFKLLAKLWDIFGERHKAREAQMKAVSVRNESRTESTSL